jgi:hypothetical protein
MKKPVLSAPLALLFLALASVAIRAQQPSPGRSPVFGNDDVIPGARPTYKLLANAVTELSMKSDPGDYIGDGEEYFFRDGEGRFSFQPWDMNRDGLVDRVYISFSGRGGNNFSFTFATNKLDMNLAEGTFRAIRDISAEHGDTGMDISGNGRGCNRLEGAFTILEAQFDYSGKEPKVISFAVKFEQHCESSSRALRGHLYYNYGLTESPEEKPQAQKRKTGKQPPKRKTN